MLSHVTIGVKDLERALAFYEPVLARLGLGRRFTDLGRGWAGWTSAGGGRPLVVVTRPYDGAPHVAGNGQMTAFLAPDREAVRDAHRLALLLGGTCEGPPGPRPHYHAHYYGAYFRDTEGNKLAVACHAPPDP
jgi:catechol 2,3-dioxygenase-like lactoylglutathione lyase family enzyme